MRTTSKIRDSVEKVPGDGEDSSDYVPVHWGGGSDAFL